MPHKRRHYRDYYEEGSWFCVPLNEGGYAVGLVARIKPQGGVPLGYFFGPKRLEVPSLEEVETLRPDEARVITQFGDLGLIEERWRVLGVSKDWKREEWPIPVFIRSDEISRTAREITYSDTDPGSIVSQKKIPYEEAYAVRGVARYKDSAVGSDGLDGAGSVEILLTLLLKD